MPKGQNPKSLENLKKGKKFTSADDYARKNAIKSKAERRSIAEEMRLLMDEPKEDGVTRRKALAEKLVNNMEKSPQWYELGLKMIGEMPSEKIMISEVDGATIEEVEKMFKG